MCGIVGVFDTRDRLPSEQHFRPFLDRLALRGPDSSGQWADAHVRLGHRRLAVLDLTEAARQPMVSLDGRFVIVFNGEIYNHLQLRQILSPQQGWRSSSDTETLLEAYRKWGVGCLGRLNGMFAFAIWDRQERVMFAARDRAGEKPLYYSWNQGAFAFASRPGALPGLHPSIDNEIDAEALRIYLELGYIPSPYSFYRRIRKLPPGHYVLIDCHGPRVVRYWDYRALQPERSWLKRTEGDLVEELDTLIKNSVRLRMTSDVPLGAFLSGGTDSAMIVCAMANLGAGKPKAFTVAFEEAAYNEGPAAAAIAAHIGIEHVTETLSVAELLALLPLYAREFDEPFADSSAFPTMAAARLARRDVTVALTGDAGDELFGGYHYYKLIERLAMMQRWPSVPRKLLRTTLRYLPSHKAKLLAGALAAETPLGAYNFMRSFAKDFAPLVRPEVLRRTVSSYECFAKVADGFSPALTATEIGMRLDLGLTLADGYLQKVDLATMAFSLEARCPLLDHHLIEWSMRLPVQFKLRGTTGKYLLKKLLSRYLPRELVYVRKRGFGAPVAQWLRGPLKAWAEELLHDDGLMHRLPLEKNRVLDLFKLHCSGQRDAHPLLWAVLMLLCYTSEHDRGFRLPPVVDRRAA